MAPQIASHDGGTDCLYRTEIKKKTKKEMKHKTKFGWKKKKNYSIIFLRILSFKEHPDRVKLGYTEGSDHCGKSAERTGINIFTLV